MRHVVSIHLVGTETLEHIETLRWYESDGPNSPDTGSLMESTRQQMYDFVDNGGDAFAVSRDKTEYSMLIAVNSHVQYVKTAPDATTSDNLLSLPRH